MNENGNAVSEDMESNENESLEIRLLLDAIHLKYGYDFRNYSRASLKRRIRKTLVALGFDHISDLQHALLYQKDVFDTLLLDLSINVTEMFRDPSFFRALREKALPLFKDQPFLRIWHAGCATGEEVYSMAIMLKELKLYDRSLIYATDLNEVVLKQAQIGIFPIDRMKQYISNYQAAGGSESFANYYTAHYDSAIFNASLKEKIVFADHNLATDGAFGEMDIVICRNVLIYFNRELQDRAFDLFSSSLCDGGLLCIGQKESIRFSRISESFEDFDRKEKIFRKKSQGL